MAREEALIVRRKISPAGKPGGLRRRRALFSEIEDPQKRFELVEEYWRRKVESMNRKKTAGAGPAVEIVAAANEEIAAQKRQLLASRSQAARQLAESPATLTALIDERDEMPFATALSRVRRSERDGVYAIAVQACLGAAGREEAADNRAMGKTLKRLIELDDTPGKRMSRKAIVKIDETDPDMFAVAVQSLPAASLSLIADETILDICSPKQLSTLIGMAAGKIFIGRSGSRGRSEAGAESQQRMRVSMGRLLDTVIERDESANSSDDPDFGFAEAVVGQLAAGQLKRLAEGKSPSFTLCKLVELADRKRESAIALADLLDPKLVEAARKVTAAFGDDQASFGEAPPNINTGDYF